MPDAAPPTAWMLRAKRASHTRSARKGGVMRIICGQVFMSEETARAAALRLTNKWRGVEHFPVFSEAPTGHPEKQWRCFHCDELFHDARAAEQHFGITEHETPACLLKGADGGLLKALRDAEQTGYDYMRQLHSESAQGVNAYHANLSRHAAALRAAEEAGYERGLADGLKVRDETRA